MINYICIQFHPSNSPSFSQVSERRHPRPVPRCSHRDTAPAPLRRSGCYWRPTKCRPQDRRDHRNHGDSRPPAAETTMAAGPFKHRELGRFGWLRNPSRIFGGFLDFGSNPIGNLSCEENIQGKHVGCLRVNSYNSCERNLF